MLAFAARTSALGVAFVVVLSGLLLAAGNQHPGSPDSLHNLVTAREIVAGRGYTTRIVHQFFIDQAVPGPETVRPPGIPLLLAALLFVVDDPLRLTVLINLAFLLGAAWFVRLAVKNLAGALPADVAAMAVLTAPCFEPMSLWNNGALVFFTALVAWLAERRLANDLRGRCGPFMLGLACGAGILMKQTFLFTACAMTVVLLVVERRRRHRLRHAAITVGVTAVMIAPWLIRDVIEFETILFSHMSPARFVARYGGGPDGFRIFPHGTWWTVRYSEPFELPELVARLGAHEVLLREVQLQCSIVVAVAGFLPAATGAALVALLRLARKREPMVLILAALFADPVVGGSYTSVDLRYLWPAFVPVIIAAALSLRFSSRWSVIVAAATIVSLMANARDAAALWEDRFVRSRLTPPAWGAEVAALVPSDARILTDDPWSAAWYAERSAVMAPTSSVEDLHEVIRRFRPDYFLWTSRDVGQGSVPFEDDELDALAGGTHLSRRWVLFALRTKPSTTGGRSAGGDDKSASPPTGS